MKSIRNLVIAATAFAVAASPALAQGNDDLPGGLTPDNSQPPTRQGTRGANFLHIGTGARALGMAGAVGSLVEGPNSWYWNPAGGSSMEQFSATVTRQNLYQNLNIAHNYLGMGIPALGGVVGVSFTSLNSGDITRTDEEDVLGTGTQFGRTFEWTATSIGLSYARRLTDRLDVGATGKFIGEGINDARTSWVGADLGVMFRTGLYGLTLGAAIQNVGPSSKASGPLLERKFNTDDIAPAIVEARLGTRETELPTAFRFSVGSDLYGRANSILGQGNGRNSLMGEVAFNDAIDTDIQVAAGLEYGFSNIFFLRGGKRFYNDDRTTGSSATFGLSGGAGMRLPIRGRSLRFDYAYTGMGDLQNVQVFSFELGR